MPCGSPTSFGRRISRDPRRVDEHRGGRRRAAIVVGLSYLRAHRRFARRESLYDQRYERNDRQHRTNYEAMLRDLLAARAERDQLTEAFERTTDSLAVVEARLARTEQQRTEAEYRSAELSTSNKQQVAEAASVQSKIAQLDAQRRRVTVEAIEREQQLKHELHRVEGRVRTLAIACQLDTESAAPLYADRPAPIELDAISARIRGLTLVDSVTISDRHGFPLDRNGTRDADDLAAMVPTVSRVAREIESVIGTVRSIAVYTADSRVVELRALPSWTRGA